MVIAINQIHKVKKDGKREGKCPQCGYYMYAVEEKEGPKGSWVVYECRNEKK
jgi:predicted  nucleic acid-binding Zn-ribbon protein